MKRSAQISIIVGIVLAFVLAIVLALYLKDKDPGESNAQPGLTAATPEPTEPTASVETEAPKKLEPSGSLVDPQTLGTDARVQITSIESVTSEAKIPGEVSGPAIRVTIEVTARDEDMNLGLTVVNVYYGKDLTPAITASGPGAKDFEGSLKAGDSYKGVQVFNVPRDQRDKVTVEFILDGSEKPLRFQGSVS